MPYIIQQENYNPPPDLSGCIALWRAVLYMALEDACFHFYGDYQQQKHSFEMSGVQKISREMLMHAQHARSFLLVDRSRFDFDVICQLADIEPAYLRRRARRAINEVDLRIKVKAPVYKAYRSSERIGPA